MKAAAEAAYRSEERLRQAVQVATIGVFDHDHLRGTIHLSPEHRELFGRPDGTISDEGFQAPPGQWPAFLAAIHPDDRESFHAAVQRAQSSDPGILDVEFRFLHPQHGVRWMALRAQTFFDGDGAARHAVRTIGAARDITEQRRAAEERERLQQQSWQARKMESVGRLAGGVAHDFNNMLMAINGNADLALEEIDANHPLRAVLTDIRSAGERAADLTRRLLGFARRQDTAPRVISLNSVVEESIKLLGRLIGEHIQLTWIPEHALGSVQIDPTQVDQILVNLVTNARDAIENTGTITIRTAEAVLDDTYCAGHPGAVPGDYVVLQVVDTGVGIDEETRTQIFEPFYTTKPLGTGLGLATVYGIVKQNDGYVDVQSAAGQGTTIQVFLPRHTESPAMVDPGVPAESPRGGPDTVLVVEDQPMVQQVTIRMLKACGYTVLAASGPTAAMRVASEWTGTIHLLLTDVVMPEMNGGELARQLVSRYPRLKCMFVSGYAHGVTLPRSIDGQDFLPKPFTHVGLTAKVREILDRPLPVERQAF
jgi:signal transduction histidine kinase/CheY-like chemotaxis protein